MILSMSAAFILMIQSFGANIGILGRMIEYESSVRTPLIVLTRMSRSYSSPSVFTTLATIGLSKKWSSEKLVLELS